MESTETKTREARRLWRAWRTAHEMLQDRGYELSQEEVNISLDRFLHEYTDGAGNVDASKLKFSAHPSEAMIKKHTPPPTEQRPDPAPECGTVWVEFMGDASDKSLGIQAIRSFIQYTVEHNFHTGIMITKSPISSGSRKLIGASANYATIEAFMLDDMLVNITHHELVPKHVLLSKIEKAALLERYRLKETQLPRIQVKDPVARYLGLKRGNVVKIIRISETAGRYASYRLTV
ncbi:hypothetical protein RB595_005465 [Gaeumannomyces hyphopodioides]